MEDRWELIKNMIQSLIQIPWILDGVHTKHLSRFEEIKMIELANSLDSHFKWIYAVLEVIIKCFFLGNFGLHFSVSLLSKTGHFYNVKMSGHF
jgi:hypothetical protein